MLLKSLCFILLSWPDQLVNSSCNLNRILIVQQLLCSLVQSAIFLIYLARALAILCKLGENYSCRSKLLGFRNSLDRYLNNPPYKKGIHITTFQQSNQMLDAKLRDMKKHGEVKKKVCIRANVAHQAGAYPGFRSMKRLGVFLLPPWMGC